MVAISHITGRIAVSTAQSILLYLVCCVVDLTVTSAHLGVVNCEQRTVLLREDLQTKPTDSYSRRCANHNTETSNIKIMWVLQRP